MSQNKISIDVEKREIVGKGLNRLRGEGKVPAVIHDHGKDSIIVMGEQIGLQKIFREAGKHHPVEVKVGSKSYMTLIKDVSLHPKKQHITHMVFNAVRANEKVDAEVPVHIQYAEGNDATPAERAGLIVLRNIEVVEVEALPKDLPDSLSFDGEKLVEVGDQVTVAELIVPKTVTVKTDAEQVLATVFEPSALQAANEAAGGDADDAAPAEEAVQTETEGDAASSGEAEKETAADK